MSLRPVQIRVRILYELLRIKIPIQIGLPIPGAPDRGSGSTSRIRKSLWPVQIRVEFFGSRLKMVISGRIRIEPYLQYVTLAGSNPDPVLHFPGSTPLQYYREPRLRIRIHMMLHPDPQHHAENTYMCVSPLAADLPRTKVNPGRILH